jgi:hypothetical protein
MTLNGMVRNDVAKPAAMSELEVDRNYKNGCGQKPKANTKYVLQYHRTAVPYNVI